MWQVVFESLLVICHRSYLFLAFDVTVDTVWFYMLLVVSSLFVTYFAVHATLFANVRPLANVLCVWLWCLTLSRHPISPPRLLLLHVPVL